MPVGEAIERRTEDPATESVQPANGFDPETARRERAAQAPQGTSMELARLRKLLSMREAARQLAQTAAAELQSALKSSETENVRVKGELARSKEQFTTARQKHKVDLDRAAARESNLTAELVEARDQIAALMGKSERSKKQFIFSFAVVIPALILMAASQWHSKVHADLSTENIVVADAATLPSAEKPAARDFAGAMGRLDRALESFSGKETEDVLRQVRDENAAHGVSVCSFDWNDGQVSMLVNKGGMDINKAMATCADAVERDIK